MTEGLKFSRTKHESLANPNMVEVKYAAQGESTNFRIMADAAGIRFLGESPLISSPMDMDALARAIGDASTDHVALKRALREKLKN